jgi:uncharacterized membrane protein HdeD (DUF308 family)
MNRRGTRLKTACVLLSAVGLAILVFGVIAAVVPSSADAELSRTIGVASVGMGLFGLMIAAIPFGRGERWAWFTLWYYPVFWIVHLAAGLPPNKDHIHQVLFITISLAALLLPVKDFFPSDNR